MRLLPLLMTLLLVVSCGKNGSTSSSTPSRGPGGSTPELEEDGCALESCNTITADGSSVDLLDSVIDVPAQVTETEITFLASKSAIDEGDRINCKTEVRNGEVYNISVNGNQLNVATSQGSYVMTRLNDSGAGVRGAWMWKGKGEQGMHIIRTLSVVNNSRVILKNHCEL